MSKITWEDSDFDRDIIDFLMLIKDENDEEHKRKVLEFIEITNEMEENKGKLEFEDEVIEFYEEIIEHDVELEKIKRKLIFVDEVSEEEKEEENDDK